MGGWENLHSGLYSRGGGGDYINGHLIPVLRTTVYGIPVLISSRSTKAEFILSLLSSSTCVCYMLSDNSVMDSLEADFWPMPTFD